ncbi:MAG: FMN-binding glutamate synthase family protein, partial [Oscillospiraceae bacterium]
MSYSPSLTSAFNGAKNRSNILSSSGMCSFCTEECLGTCELGLAAVLGSQTVYPTNTGSNQVASEKEYPIDFSHFNINGHVFGAKGTRPNYEDATIFNVKMERSYGVDNQVKIALPFMLPAVIKLNWKDYFAGAAMAGVCCVIGEGCPSKDPNLQYKDGKIVKFEMLGEMLDSFRKYYRGYGQIILQCNVEDDMQGLPEYAIKEQGAQAIEFKFGQAAKGTQPARFIKGGYEAAIKKQAEGYIVRPDPSAPDMKKAFEEGVCPNFYAY